MPTTIKPDKSEAAPQYSKYIDLVGGDDICQFLNQQLSVTLAFLQEISEGQSLHRYAPEKWSIRQVLSHVNDTERAFAFRSLWFARGFDIPLNSFDPSVATANANADERTWKSHVEEFRVVRNATLALFENLPQKAWDRRGIVSGNPFTVRAIAFVAGGHVAHHLNILRERYL